jgi:thiamine transport system ATP-binding protein
MIKLDDVDFRWEDFRAHFDLDIGKGEFVAVIGPSGSGKSTLLSLIAGFEQPASGRILLDGKDMTDAPPGERPVTTVFQDHNTFAHLDLWTNVALGISPSLALSIRERQDVDIVLARVGLAAMAKRRPGEISGGERQRVAIARALLRNRPILLLDEPFAALGPALRTEMLGLLKELQKERGYTTVLVSHHPEDARQAAERTVFLADGKIVAIAPTEELFARRDLPELVNYLGNT